MKNNTTLRSSTSVGRKIRQVVFSDRHGAALLLVIAVIVCTCLTENFLTWVNIRNLLRFASFYMIVGLGVMVLFVSGNMDLSVGSTMGLAGMVAAMMAAANMNVWAILVVSILVGVAVGCINGLLIGYGKLVAFVTTLGMQRVIRGLVTYITGGYPVTGLSDDFMHLGTGSVVGVPLPIVFALIIAIITYYLLNRTKLGRHIAATGDNEQAAIISGINTKGVKLFAYIYTGACAALAGIILTARVQSGQTNTGEGFEMDAIAGAIIGGSSMGGGSGTVLGTICGILVIYTIKNGMSLMNIDPYLQQIIQGLIIVLAVLLDAVRKKQQR